MTFDKRQTNIAKGIAILLLLWRHLFQPGVEVDSLLCVFGMPIEIYDVNVSVLVYLILTVICFVVAWVVLFIQHIILYDKLTHILFEKH